MGDSFGEGDTFYVQFRQKISQSMIDNLDEWDSFWKTVIFHMNTSTANGVEITTVHPNSQSTIYSDSGAYSMTTGTADPDYENTPPLLVQQAWDLDAGEPWGTEEGGITSQYPSVNWDFPGDEWVTCYYKISLGTFTLNHTGPNDSTIEFWVQEPGNDYWTKIVSGRFALAYNTADTDVYNNITLTPYMTSLSTSASEDAEIWYTELIVSSNEIAIPPVIPVTPAWRKGMAVNEWKQVSSSTLSDVTVSDPGAGSRVNTVIAWNGSCVDPDNSTIYMLANGGHGDWAGNEVYKLDLTADTPTWALAEDTSTTVQGNVAWYNDGKPTSSHTYNQQVFVPQIGRAMRIGVGSAYGGPGDDFHDVAGFNVASDQWDAEGTYPDIPGTANGLISWPACVDSSTGDVYVHCLISGAYTIAKWDRASNTWSTSGNGLGSTGWYPYEACAAYDSTRDRILWGKGTSSWLYSIGAGTSASQTLTGGSIANQSGMIYCPTNDKYYFKSVNNDGSLNEINPSTFAISSVSTTGGGSISNSNQPASATATIGVYNRFNYVPELGGAYYISSFTDGVWFIRLF
jgi:hypothetical protein